MTNTNCTLQFDDVDGTIQNENGKITFGRGVFSQSGTQFFVPNLKVEVKSPLMYGTGVLTLGTPSQNEVHLQGSSVHVKSPFFVETGYFHVPASGIVIGSTYLTEANLIALKSLLQ
jgi:hypothetical protein